MLTKTHKNYAHLFPGDVLGWPEFSSGNAAGNVILFCPLHCVSIVVPSRDVFKTCGSILVGATPTIRAKRVTNMVLFVGTSGQKVVADVPLKIL